MICRGGIVVGGWGDVGGGGQSAAASRRPMAPSFPACAESATPWPLVLVGIGSVALVLAMLPGRAIPPLIESDYCYLLIAAERFANGQGFSSLQPVAPFQPWEWRYDWGFLTQWPAGYSLLIAGIRKVFSCSSLAACRAVSVVCCSAALVGWLAFIRRALPSGITGWLIGGIAAASSLTVGFLINPSTDLILIAMLPFISALIVDGCKAGCAEAGRFAVPGLLAGALFWFRYASVFVPAAIGLFLLWEIQTRRLTFRHLAAFSFAAAVPIVALVLVNMWLGPDRGAAAKFNLGLGAGFDLSLSDIARAWWMFTDFGFYAHRRVVHWFFALAPAAIAAAFAFRAIPFFPAAPALQASYRIALCLGLTMLLMLVTAKAVFGSKFDYIGLERYYLPARPLYFVLVFAPLLLIPRRALRISLCVLFLLIGSWVIRQDWSSTYQRWARAERPATEFGAWSRAFEPHARGVYAWLRASQANPDVLIFSNFHEYIALETGIAALPIPKTHEAFDEMLVRAKTLRGIQNPKPVFALNPQNLWRSYWIDEPAQIIDRFNLQPVADAPVELRGYLFAPRGLTDDAGLDHLTLTSWN